MRLGVGSCCMRAALYVSSVQLGTSDVRKPLVSILAREHENDRSPSALMHRNDKELIVVGDRVLVKVEEGEERTKVGLYLPSTALDSQAVQGGTIMATGPGQPMPSFESQSGEEPWKETAREMRFVPMQARRGDYALFFRKAAVEITFENERYLVVPQAAILALVRE